MRAVNASSEPAVNVSAAAMRSLSGVVSPRSARSSAATEATAFSTASLLPASAVAVASGCLPCPSSAGSIAVAVTR